MAKKSESSAMDESRAAGQFCRGGVRIFRCVISTSVADWTRLHLMIFLADCDWDGKKWRERRETDESCTKLMRLRGTL